LSEQIISNGENNPAFSVTAYGGNNKNKNNKNNKNNNNNNNNNNKSGTYRDETAVHRPCAQLRKRESGEYST
jgi:hypothetical protein